MRKSYTSDLTDAQWALIEPLIPPARTGGDKRTSDMREGVDGIFYVLKNGCQWRDLPGDFAPDYRTVYAYFNAWSVDGTMEAIYNALHRRWRIEQGREETPSAAIIDSQVIKTSESGGERGFDGGKRLLGRKRHLMVDTEGFPVEVVKKAEDGSFQVLPRRGVVERTFAWLLKCRRLCRDFEHRIESVVGFIHAAMLRLLLRRLAPSTPTS